MSKLAFLKKLTSIDKMMLVSNTLFIVAFLFLTKTMTFQTIEYMILGLVLASIVIILAKVINTTIEQYSAIVDIVNLVIAGFIAVRYGMAFVTDFTYFIALILFLATVGFSVVFVLSIRQFVSLVKNLSTTK